jgi:hypothetical protein
MSAKPQKAQKKVDFAGLAERHLRALEAGKAGYKAADQLLDELITAGAPVGQPIQLRSGEVVTIKDRFANTNKVGYGGAARRYEIDVERAKDITAKL